MAKRKAPPREIVAHGLWIAPLEGVDLNEWKQAVAADPGAAAAEFFRRVDTLSPAQRSAIWAWLPTANELTRRMAAGRNCPLGGAPYALKDLFHVAGLPTRGGGILPVPSMIEPRETDGTLVQALTEAGGALAGKTQLHEFAYGLTGENPHHGDVDHPAFPGHTSGGSSSGSAAAVAAGIVPFGIGTDTGGSIRVPAAFCGIFGIRFSPGHRWMTDGFPLAPSFDTAGWFTRTAGDMRELTDVLIGLGELTREPRGVALGLESVGGNAEETVRAALAKAAGGLAEPADADVAETFAHVMRNAGLTYSIMQSTEALAVHRDWLDVHRADYGEGVWRLIDRGRNWTDEQRAAAALSFAGVERFWTQFFLTWDFLVLPATPFPALAKADCTPENRARLLALTAPASLGGLPVLTVPVHLGGGRTTGLQIIVNSPHSPVIPWALRRCANCYGVPA